MTKSKTFFSKKKAQELYNKLAKDNNVSFLTLSSCRDAFNQDQYRVQWYED